MKKILLALGALIAVVCPTHAQQATPPAMPATPVRSIVQFMTQCSSVTLSSTPTEMTGNSTSTVTSAGISTIKVVNLDTAIAVCCSDNPNVSCTAGNNNYGDPISGSSGQKNWISWPISIYQKWFCASASGAPSVIACKVR